MESNDKKYICEICNKEFKTENALKSHKTKMHKNEKKDKIPEKENTTLKKIEVIEKKQYKDSDMILVRNGAPGRLIFKAPKSNFVYVFNSFGDEEEIPFEELKLTRSGDNIKFFKNHWFLIDNIDVLDQLGVKRFYTNSLNFDEFESLFDCAPDEIKNKISKLTLDQRITVGILAREKINNNEISDLNVIHALEVSLDTEFLVKQ